MYVAKLHVVVLLVYRTSSSPGDKCVVIKGSIAVTVSYFGVG